MSRPSLGAYTCAVIVIASLAAAVGAAPGPLRAQDVLPGAPTLQPVETGVAAFVGVVPAAQNERARPVVRSRRPIEVTDWASFVSRFGEVDRPPARWSDDDARAQRHLQEAVRGFFANGGSRLWILVVATADDLADPTDELQSLARLDVDLVAIPGATGHQQQDALIAHAETAGDRMALLDGIADPTTTTPSGVRATAHNSSRAVGLFPWLSVRHPDGRGVVMQPPSGHVAGVIARNDRQAGVHRAPANLSVDGATGPERSLSNSQISALTVDGILVLRPLSGGLRTWGGRTLGGAANGEFMYLSVRRTIDMVVETVRDGLAPSACSNAVGPVEALLEDLWREGALQGATPDQAWFTRCRRGSDVLRIGLALIRPAEFVVASIDLGAVR